MEICGGEYRESVREGIEKGTGGIYTRGGGVCGGEEDGREWRG